MSDANRTLDEFIALFATKHHITGEQAKDFAAVQCFKQYLGEMEKKNGK